MSKKNSRRRSLTDPFDLPPLDRDGMIQVIIETPKGSRNKYSFEPELRIFSLKKVLPAGMTFPYDFGFVPSTKAEDGDPTGKKKNGERNDRIIAVEEANHSYAHIRHVKELGKKFVNELEEFFVNYHHMQGKSTEFST